MFEPGVLPEEFPQARERKTRQPTPQGTEPQAMAAEAEAMVAEEATLPEAQPAETVEAPALAPEDAPAADESMDALAEVVVNGKPTMAEALGSRQPAAGDRGGGGEHRDGRAARERRTGQEAGAQGQREKGRRACGER
jgi:hypothetical protein